MWVILATFIPIIWYYFDLPGAAFVDYSCILIIVISTFVNKNLKSVLFFLGTVMLFLIAVSISILLGAFAFFLVLFAVGILFDTTRKKEQYDNRDYGGGFNSNPIIRPANTGYGGYGGAYDHNDDYEVQEEERMRQAEEDARRYRQQGGNEYKVNEADNILGRDQYQRNYEDAMYAARCFGCGEIERDCRCCTCNDHPCLC